MVRDADEWLGIAQAFAGPPGQGRAARRTVCGMSAADRQRSGFYGDRFARCARCSRRRTLDVLTGDYLAELTMLILGRDRLKDPAAGYAQDVPAPDGGLPGDSRSTGREDRRPTRRAQPGRTGQRDRELTRLGLHAKIAHVER